MPAKTRRPARPGVPEHPGPWLTIEVDRSALAHNIRGFRSLVAPAARLMAVVKANAYGHGLLIAAEAFLEGGADLLGVHSLSELTSLRDGGVTAPVLVLGPLTGAEAVCAAGLGAEVTAGSLAMVRELAGLDLPTGQTLPVHLKVETGVNRQGVTEDELDEAAALLASAPSLEFAALSSHFADVEDTTDHGFALAQMERFAGYRERLATAGFGDLDCHMSCSASTLLWDRTHHGLARVGIAAYGVWPSRETLVSVRQRGRDEIELRTALTWKVRIAQVREVTAGETVGYGRTWKAMTDSRIAVLPVGFADGWPRSLSGRAHVLVGGKRAPLVGRICMNLCMVDVTHISGVHEGDPAVLLGRQGEEVITAEMLADHLGTIAYEVLTLPRETWTCIPV